MKATTFGQLATAYNPQMESRSACNVMRQWIKRVPGLEEQMELAGFHRGASLMSPRVVQLVIDALGEP